MSRARPARGRRIPERLAPLIVAVVGILIGTTALASANPTLRSPSSRSAAPVGSETRVGVARLPAPAFVGSQAPGTPVFVGQNRCTYDRTAPASCVATKPGVAAGESGVFRNVHPEDVPGAFQRVAPDVAAARSGRYVYVVTEDGTLVIGRAGRAGHIDLANGQPVRAAREFTTKGGEVVAVNNASGHYLPSGASAQQAALDAMRARGLKVTGPYTEVGG